MKFSGPIQRFMCSARDHRSNTSDTGASKVRTISSSLSALLLWTLMTFSFLDLFDVGRHLVEALLPELPIDREPVVDGPETVDFDLAGPPLRRATTRNQAGALQHLEMSRHR